MPIIDLFSKRQKRLRGDVPDIFSYDSIPQALRVQIVHIWRDVLGNQNHYSDPYGDYSGFGTYAAYKFLVETLCREYGMFTLSGGRPDRQRNYMEELHSFFLAEEDTERVVDAIEISFRIIDKLTRKYDFLKRRDYDEAATDAINELNTRLREHGVGYQFERGDIVRVDSAFIHEETVKPALRVLSDPRYKGAQQEFLRAHEHYRHGNMKESINEALKAFESTLKTICAIRSWKIPDSATSRTLLEKCFAEGLIPAFWQSNMAGLRAILEGGVPTVRNRASGHGQGPQPTVVPEHIAAYVLHMTAAAVVFLAASEENLSK